MPADPTSSKAIRIAVLDDTSATRMIIERVLIRHLDCEVISAATPDELYTHCSASPPDLFILDIVLEGTKSGLDVCRELKSKEATRDIPVIFMSVHNQPQTRADALRSGGIDYIDKPFYPEEFLLRVKGCVDRSRYQRSLEMQSREQMALLRVLCHDLRNSVGSGMSVLDLLHETENQRERELYIDICSKSIKSAMDLINHVGKYRSLVDGTSALNLETIPATEACEEAFNIVGTMATTKGVKLYQQITPNLTLWSNRVVLVHNIIVNLLTNAIKFSRPGSGVWVEGKHEIGPDGTPTACLLSVRDEGIGIPPHIRETLLKNKLVTSRPGTSKEEGTGTGMSLVQLYTERCGGSITIDSQIPDPKHPELKSGTCVRLRFPITGVA